MPRVTPKKEKMQKPRVFDFNNPMYMQLSMEERISIVAKLEELTKLLKMGLDLSVLFKQKQAPTEKPKDTLEKEAEKKVAKKKK